MSENAISGPLDIVRSMSGHWAVAQKAIYLPLEISQSMRDRGRPMKVMLSDQPGIPIKFAY